MKKRTAYFINANTEPIIPGAPPPPPPAPPPDADAVAKARYEADLAKAEADRLKARIEELTKSQPSPEQLARLAQLEQQEREQEDARKRKEGEFDEWRRQLAEEKERELAREREETAVQKKLAEANDKALNDTLIGLAFSSASEWFGPGGKTVLLPEIAQSYFASHVAIEVSSTGQRSVVVKDFNNKVILDTKSGKPAEFKVAIGEVIEQYPQKAHILRGSGKVGSGSSGGDHALGERDLTKLRAADFKNKDVRDAVRDSLAAPGGLVMGSAFDRIERDKRNKP